MPLAFLFFFRCIDTPKALNIYRKSLKIIIDAEGIKLFVPYLVPRISNPLYQNSPHIHRFHIHKFPYSHQRQFPPIARHFRSSERKPGIGLDIGVHKT